MKAHSDIYAGGRKTVRIGRTVPPSDVNLAYCFAGEVLPDDTVEVRDAMSASLDVQDALATAPCLVLPDEGAILRRKDNSTGAAGDPYFLFRHLALTNMFTNYLIPTTDNALYYAYSFLRCFAGRSDDLGPDTQTGIYTGQEIQLFTATGAELSPDDYQIWLERTAETWVYKATLYCRHTDDVIGGLVVRYAPALSSDGVAYVRGSTIEEIVTLRSVFTPDDPDKKYELVDDGSGRGYKFLVPGYVGGTEFKGFKFTWRVRGNSSLGWPLTTDVFADIVSVDDGNKALSTLTCEQLLAREHPGVTFTSVVPELVWAEDSVVVYKGADGLPYANTSAIPSGIPSILGPGPLDQTFTLEVRPYLCRKWTDFSWHAAGTGQRVALASTHGAGRGNGLWRLSNSSGDVWTVNDYALGHTGNQYWFHYNWDTTTEFSTYVYVTRNVNVTFNVGNNDDITIYVNNVKQYSSGYTSSYNSCTLRLSKGWNRIRGVVHETGFFDNWTWAFTVGAFHYHLEQALGLGVPYIINDQLVTATTYYSDTADGSARCSLYPTQDTTFVVSSSLPADVVDFSWQTITTDNPNVTLTPAPDFASSGRVTAHMKDVVPQEIGIPVSFAGWGHPTDGIMVITTIGDLPRFTCVRASDYSPEDQTSIYYVLTVTGEGVNARYRLSGTANYSVLSYGPYMGRSAVSQAQCETLPASEIIVWVSYEKQAGSETFAIRPIDAGISVVSMHGVTGGQENWYPAVRDFAYTRVVTLPNAGAHLYDLRPELAAYAGQSVTLFYVMPEYAGQAWSQRMPIMRLTEVPTVVGSNVLSVSCPIYLGGVADGGDPYGSIALSYGRVSSVNPKKGLIYLDRPIPPGITPSVTYDAEVYYYRYRGYNQGDAFIHLDLNPRPYHTLVADSSLVVPGHTQALTDRVLHAVRDAIGREFIIYAIPYSISCNARVIEGSVRNRVLYHTTLSRDELLARDPTALVLATISVNPPVAARNVVVIDTRSRGGGLREDITEDIIDKICPEARFYWDIGHWDGTAYKESGVLVIELPRTVLRAYGGRFTEDEVLDAVHQYLAFGVLPQVRYY